MRDKHQNLIRRLEAGDFEVLEDTVPQQQIKMFRFVGGKEAVAGDDQLSAAGAKPQKQRGLDPLRQIKFDLAGGDAVTITGE